MPADLLRRLRGPERPAAALPALSPLPPCCGPPEAILRGAEGLRPAAAAPMASLLPGGRLLLLLLLLLPQWPLLRPASGPCCGLPGLPTCGRPCPPDRPRSPPLIAAQRCSRSRTLSNI